ncbi:MAG TPA: HAD-IC family P-type ATPase, partial [Abditibacteriaceae bacterium]|nr:HAD-IC family P-type ATPase [Abditibacteriaceae bacterium]
MRLIEEQVWHQAPATAVLQALQSDAERGLSAAEAQRRQAHFGRNILTPKKAQSALVRFLLQFNQPLLYILLGSAFIAALFGEWVDASVIFGVVLVNAIIGFVQEDRALKSIDALGHTLTTEATVVRDGQTMRMPATELVPGDVVALWAGDKVPADLRLLRARDFHVDESALTGESLPVEKATAPLEGSTILAERTNMAYASTMATYGHATGVVVTTGDRTEVGRISQLISTAQEMQTPLTRKIAQFSRLLLFAILGLAALTIVIGVARGASIFEMFMAAVALAVGAIPEGLPAAVTIMLAIGVSQMASRRALIRKLPAVETLGSTTVICSDKTGTLTENQMTVQAIRAGNEEYSVSGLGYAPQGEILQNGAPVDVATNVALKECLIAGLLCNDSHLVCEADSNEIHGDPTEGALIVSALKAGLHRDRLGTEYSRVDAIPFESAYQYMATLHRSAHDGGSRVYIKGSLEALLPKCTAVLDAGGTRRAIDHEQIRREVEDMAAAGVRVLAFATADLPPQTTALQHEDIAGGLTFLGLQGMIDPPRAEANSAVEKCLQAGIAVKMITGDHARTAAAIAGQIGLRGETVDGELTALTGQELASLSDAALADAAERVAVFARVTPEQKLRLVQALQRRGHVVAMTGDGVNDAPALKQSNIGIAMGKSGTDVAREAADMVLTDDNFASIEAAVEEGRSVYDNLTKFIVWTLPTNLG